MREDRSTLSALALPGVLLGAAAPLLACNQRSTGALVDLDLHGVQFYTRQYAVRISEPSTPSSVVVVQRLDSMNRAANRASWLADLNAMRNRAIAGGMRLRNRDEIAEEMAQRRSVE